MIFKHKKPIFLLDIDGCFNAFHKLEEPRELIEHPYGVWQVSKQNCEFLKYISKEYKCFWISSWIDESNVINRYLGIKPFKALFEKDKQDALAKVIDKYKNIIIIDDEFADGRCFCIMPDQTTGLTSKDINNILSYLRSFK